MKNLYLWMFLWAIGSWVYAKDLRFGEEFFLIKFDEKTDENVKDFENIVKEKGIKNSPCAFYHFHTLNGVELRSPTIEIVENILSLEKIPYAKEEGSIILINGALGRFKDCLESIYKRVTIFYKF